MYKIDDGTEGYTHTGRCLYFVYCSPENDRCRSNVLPI